MEKLTAEQKQLVNDNLNLVYFTVNKLCPLCKPGTYEYEDVSAQGYLDLCKAAKTYDKDKNVKFCTYAYTCIKFGILNYFNRKTGWAFHIRKDPYSKIEHIPYSSLNMIVCEGDKKDGDHELCEIVPDKDNIFDYAESYLCALEAFKKASKKHGEKIFELRMQGCNQVEIANVLGINQSFVSRIIIKANKIYSCA